MPLPESQACNLIKKETLSQVFPLRFCKIFQNRYFGEDFWATVFVFEQEVNPRLVRKETIN